jgi:hypothetical protein
MNVLVIGYWNLPFDVAQGGEPVEPFAIWILPFDVAQGGELVEPLVLYECCLKFESVFIEIRAN